MKIRMLSLPAISRNTLKNFLMKWLLPAKHLDVHSIVFSMVLTEGTLKAEILKIQENSRSTFDRLSSQNSSKEFFFLCNRKQFKFLVGNFAIADRIKTKFSAIESLPDVARRNISASVFLEQNFPKFSKNFSFIVTNEIVSSLPATDAVIALPKKDDSSNIFDLVQVEVSLLSCPRYLLSPRCGLVFPRLFGRSVYPLSLLFLINHSITFIKMF